MRIVRGIGSALTEDERLSEHRLFLFILVALFFCLVIGRSFSALINKIFFTETMRTNTPKPSFCIQQISLEKKNFTESGERARKSPSHTRWTEGKNMKFLVK